MQQWSNTFWSVVNSLTTLTGVLVFIIVSILGCSVICFLLFVAAAMISGALDALNAM